MTEQEFLRIYEDKESELKHKKGRLESATGSLNTLRSSLDNQAYVLQKEKGDVENLSKLSVKNLFMKITSKMEESVIKEEREYFEAKVKYEELENSVYQTEKEIREMRADVGLLERELRNLKEDGRKQFAGIDRMFNDTENKIIQLKAEVKELDEAIDSGERVCSAIRRAINKLEKARGWATYDTFTKGGILSHMAKYGNIDEAQEIIKEIGHLMDKFQLELKDVNIAFYGDADKYDSTTRFVDFFFDNIFTDLRVRGQITDDIERLGNLQKRIESIKKELIKSKKTTLNKISGLMLG